MASRKDAAQEKKGEKTHEKERTALNNGYAAIVGQQAIQTFTAFTFEEAMEAQLERIEGGGTDLRPNLLDRVDRIENELKDAVAKVIQIPPEQFLEKDEERDVNTDP
jgi:hypothetical protein